MLLVDQSPNETYSIIADTDSGSNVGKAPKTALHKIQALFLEILEFLD